MWCNEDESMRRWYLLFLDVDVNKCTQIHSNCNNALEQFIDPAWLGFVQICKFVVCFTHLCHGRHRIHHGMPIRKKIVTLRMDLGSFSLSMPHEKLHKYIPLVTIFHLIGEPLWILYLPINNSIASENLTLSKTRKKMYLKLYYLSPMTTNFA